MRGCHISPFFTIQPVLYVIKQSASPEFFTIERFLTILLFGDSTVIIGKNLHYIKIKINCPV